MLTLLLPTIVVSVNFTGLIHGDQIRFKNAEIRLERTEHVYY